MLQEWNNLLKDTKSAIALAEKTSDWEICEKEALESFLKPVLLLYENSLFTPFFSKVATALTTRNCAVKLVQFNGTWPNTPSQTIVAPFHLVQAHAPFKHALQSEHKETPFHFENWTYIPLPSDIQVCERVEQKKRLWGELKRALDL